MSIGERARLKAIERHRAADAWFERASAVYLEALVTPAKTYTLDGKRMTRQAWLAEVHRQLVQEIKRRQRRETGRGGVGAT